MDIKAKALEIERAKQLEKQAHALWDEARAIRAKSDQTVQLHFSAARNEVMVTAWKEGLFDTGIATASLEKALELVNEVALQVLTPPQSCDKESL